jgi:hypothetical protein
MDGAVRDFIHVFRMLGKMTNTTISSKVEHVEI